MIMEFREPYSDEDMIYDKSTRRYILTEDFVLNKGINLSLELNTDGAPDASSVARETLKRVSLLVYSNIYNYGRDIKTKEYLLACNPELRQPIRDAMLERLKYMIHNGDLSISSGTSINHGVRIETDDLIPSVIEEMILRPTGILHRGKWAVPINKELDY